MVTTAAILAGGLSKRMGQDKALLPLEGKPLALRTAQLLKSCGIEQVYVVGRQPELQSLGLPVIVEVSEEHHPLYGVAAALHAIDSPLLLILPCDLVGLMPQHIQAIVDFGGPCVASNQGVIHPLVALLPPVLADRAAQIAKDGGSAHRLVEGLPIIELPIPGFTDANHPEQLPR